MSYNHNKYELNESVGDDEFISYPIDNNGNMRSWKWSKESILSERKNDVAIRLNQDKQYAIYAKSRMKDEGMLPLSWWEKSDYSATSQGNNLLESILGKNQFNYPKSLYAVIDSLKIECQKVGTVLDVFMPRKDIDDNIIPGVGNAYVEFASVEECKYTRKVSILFLFNIVPCWE